MMRDSALSKRRVVVTGLGMLSPLGNSVADGWSAALAGKSGIGRITRFDVTGFPCTIAGSIPVFDVSKYMPAKEARRMDLFMQYGVAAGVQAIADAGIEVTEANRLYMRMKWPTIDVSRRSVEETAAAILNIIQEHDR